MLQRFVVYKPYAENVGTVVSILSGNIPDDSSNGVYTSSQDPEIKNYPNLSAVLRIELDSKELFYDYESSTTIEMRVVNLASNLNDLELQKEELANQVSSLNTDITDTQVAVTESYETTLEVEKDNTKTQLALTEVYEDLQKTKAALSTVNLAIQTLQTEIAKLKGE
ncbi:hypothetical protein [Paenibacillus sp. Marseille-Q4541]|uniref:hypothetical protein n=1 Tax=Paenibacillus sp. Marseille-Q4541 TaxID=2831522 RepID=UPI001BA88F3B|nr:hypothetical protein [Paenibacillus sp. Marseille-Q4541]